MKTSYLFPHRLKAISGVVFVVSFVLLTAYYVIGEDSFLPLKTKVFAIVGYKSFTADDTEIPFDDTLFFGWTENSVTDELLMLLVVVSGIIFAFAKEKHEDEMVASIRLQSLAWATIINYGILLFGYLFIYGFAFINVMMAALVSQLLIFILLFRYKMYRFYTTLQHEE